MQQRLYCYLFNDGALYEWWVLLLESGWPQSESLVQRQCSWQALSPLLGPAKALQMLTEVTPQSLQLPYAEATHHQSQPGFDSLREHVHLVGGIWELPLRRLDIGFATRHWWTEMLIVAKGSLHEQNAKQFADDTCKNATHQVDDDIHKQMGMEEDSAWLWCLCLELISIFMRVPSTCRRALFDTCIQHTINAQIYLCWSPKLPSSYKNKSTNSSHIRWCYSGSKHCHVTNVIALPVSLKMKVTYPAKTSPCWPWPLYWRSIVMKQKTHCLHCGLSGFVLG